jgi:hypothetical protein
VRNSIVLSNSSISLILDGPCEIGFIIGAKEVITYEVASYRGESMLNNTDGKIYGKLEYSIGEVIVKQMSLFDVTEEVMVREMQNMFEVTTQFAN